MEGDDCLGLHALVVEGQEGQPGLGFWVDPEDAQPEQVLAEQGVARTELPISQHEPDGIRNLGQKQADELCVVDVAFGKDALVRLARRRVRAAGKDGQSQAEHQAERERRPKQRINFPLHEKQPPFCFGGSLCRKRKTYAIAADRL